jgi:hypothetical protein
MGLKSTYEGFTFIKENKGLVLIGIIGVVLILTWSSDYGNSTPTTNY